MLMLLWQVFDFIMDSLDKYRTLYRRMAQLARDGVISAHGSLAHSQYPRQVRNCHCTQLLCIDSSSSEGTAGILT